MSKGEHIASASPRLAVVGGGISGLLAAYYAVKNGQDPSAVDIYEGSARLGGKLENAAIGNEVVNKGGEFIDSTNMRLRAVCKELGVQLMDCPDQQAQHFQMPNGSLMSGEQFMEMYRPIAEQVFKDKQAIAQNPEGEVARRLDGMSAEEYIKDLAARTPLNPERTYMQAAWDFITFKTNRVAPDVVNMALTAYSSECGRPAASTNALQYVMESGNSPEDFLESDCASRVVGGTQRLVEAIRQHLEQKGVQFHCGHTLESLDKNAEGKLNLNFTQAGEEKIPPAQADKVVLALPAYRMGQVQGLENLGFDAETLKTINDVQYAQNVKFTVKLKEGAVVPDANTFLANGVQTWSPAPGQLTFLCTVDMGKTRPNEYIGQCLEQMALTQAMRAEDMFELGQGNIVFANPGAAACYAAPAKGQLVRMMELRHSLDAAAANGVALAGTYFPMANTNGRQGIGFMECGANSAMEASMRLCPPTVSRGQEVAAQRQLPPAGLNRPASRSFI